MSSTAANMLAGGPKVYLALEGQALPTLTDATLTWSNNDVQTISKDGTVSGGTYTIEIVYPDATSETTAAIAYDADAATIKAALAALSGLTADDLTVTGGPASTTDIVITFTGTYANTYMTLCIVDDASITGGGTLASAHTTSGRLWAEIPDPCGDVTVDHIHEVADYTPAYSLHPTHAITTKKGIKSLSFEIQETDLDAFNLAFLSTLKDTTAPGAGTVGYETLTQAVDDDDIPYQTLCTVKKGPAGDWGQLEHFFRVKRLEDQQIVSGGGKDRRVKINFKVLAHATYSYQCSRKYEYTLPATS